MRLFFLVPLVVFGFACGGGGSGHRSGSGNRTGTLKVRVEWPDRARTPYASESVLVSVKKDGTEVKRSVIARPTAGLESTAEFTDLKTGTVDLDFSAHPNADGSGTAQAVGATQSTVEANRAAEITADVASTVRTVSLLPLAVREGETAPPSIDARNLEGQLVLVDPRDVGITFSNERAVVESGAVKGVSYGSTVMKASAYPNARAVVNVLPRDESAPLRVRLLVLNFDPPVASQGGKLLHQALGYIDPHILLQGYIDDLRRESHGMVELEVKEWRDHAYIPTYDDGFQYSPDEYFDLRRAGSSGWHTPMNMGLRKILADDGAAAAISNGQFDEVVVMGDHYYGIPESAMAGPGAWTINGPVLADVQASRPFAIMTFSFERRTAETLHNLGHRMEDTGQKFFGSWNLKNPVSAFDRFSTYRVESGGLSGIGTCHFPANGTDHYDYGNPNAVVSTAPAWRIYPTISTATESVSAATWAGPHNEQLADGSEANGPDYHRNYLCWYYRHLPHAPGTTDGKLNNWWRYLFEFYRWSDGYVR